MATPPLSALFAPNNANPKITFKLSSMKALRSGLSALGLNSVENIPDEFSWKENGDLAPPPDQGVCGNCWAQASINALTDKFRVFKKVKDLVLDPIVLTTCVKTDMMQGCNGGMPYYAGKWLEENGATDPKKDGQCSDGTTLPTWKEYYESSMSKVKEFLKANPSATPEEVQKATMGILMSFECTDVLKKCKFPYKVASGSTRSLTIPKNDGSVDPQATLHNIKTSIMNTGPVVAVFQVYYDLQAGNSIFTKPDGIKYKWDATRGIYIPGSYTNDLQALYNNAPDNLKQSLAGMNGKWGEPAEGGNAYHAVEIVGWGKDDTYGSYWIVKNSWGTGWADGGYWKHIMWAPDKNSCFIDVPTIYSDKGGLGGCITFTIDESVDVDGGDDKPAPAPSPPPKPEPKPTPPPRPTPPPDDSSRSLSSTREEDDWTAKIISKKGGMIALYVVVGILVLALIYEIYSFYTEKSDAGSTTPVASAQATVPAPAPTVPTPSPTMSTPAPTMSTPAPTVPTTTPVPPAKTATVPGSNPLTRSIRLLTGQPSPRPSPVVYVKTETVGDQTVTIISKEQ